MPFLFHVVIPLPIYLAGTRTLSFHAFACSLFSAVVAAMGRQLIPLQPVLDFLALNGLAYYWVQLWKGYEVMLQFIPLLAAMWAAQYRRNVPQASVIAS
jgi:hypothetical protein